MIKNIKYLAVFLFITAISVSCERELGEDAVPATFANTAEVFTDNFVGMGSDFYFPFLGAKPDVFSVDQNEGFESDAAIRIDVPNADDPAGGFAGAIFRVDGAGRNLTQYDALTFYARSSFPVTIGEFGFGTDFFGDNFATKRFDVDVTTNWTKFVIPIPDPSLLTEERGMFQFAAGGIGPEGQEVGYSFWIDELKFETLGTIAITEPSINGGLETTVNSFEGGTAQISGYSVKSDVNGNSVRSSATSAYFDFQSSDPSVATVDETGLITVVGVGEATITASMAGVAATGSIVIVSDGGFETAPVPTRDASEVISLYSDAYEDRPVSVLSTFGGQTSTLNAFQVGDDNILNYQNVNFFALEFNSNVELPLIDGSEVTMLHVDVFIPGDLEPGALLNIALRDAGPNGMVETDIFTGQPIEDDTQVDTNVPLASGEWIAVDFNITGLSQRSALAQIALFSPDQGPNEFYLDNIYFY